MAVGWEALLNRAGTTFRKLPDAAKQDLDGSEAIALMLEQPSMIKRPVLERGDFRIETQGTLREHGHAGLGGRHVGILLLESKVRRRQPARPAIMRAQQPISATTHFAAWIHGRRDTHGKDGVTGALGAHQLEGLRKAGLGRCS